MAAKRRHAQVVNVDEVELRERQRGAFVQRSRQLGRPAAGRALGCSHFELPAGKTAFPFHYHSAIEEAIYVLSGTGCLRIGKEEVEVRAGDYIAFPAGPASAHALRNTGSSALSYLCMSGPAMPMTMDIVGYPDSNKVGFASGIQPEKEKWYEGAWVMKLVKQDQPDLEYYADEPLAAE